MYKSGNLGVTVEAGTDPKKLPSLPKGAVWKPLSNGQNLASLRGVLAVPPERDAEEQVRGEGYCIKWLGKRIVRRAP